MRKNFMSKSPTLFLALFFLLLLFVLAVSLPASQMTHAQTGEDWMTYEDYDPLLLPGYEGTWSFAVPNSSALGGQMSLTSTAGASLTFQIQVTEATGGYSIRYASGPDGGAFEVQVNHTVRQYSSYSETEIYNREITDGSLPAGMYTITITNGDGTFWLEAIMVNQGPRTIASEISSQVSITDTLVFEQYFHDLIWDINEAIPTVSGYPVAEISAGSGNPAFGMAARAFITVPHIAQQLELRVDLQLGHDPDQVYRIVGQQHVGNAVNSCINFSYPDEPSVVEWWYEINDINGNLLYRSPTCPYRQHTSCIFPIPPGGIDQAKSISFIHREFLSPQYCEYDFQMDNFRISVEPSQLLTCQLIDLATYSDLQLRLTQQALDMHAVVNVINRPTPVDQAQSNGLIVHAGPTFNAQPLDTLAWDTGFIPDFRYEIYDEADDL